MKKRILFMTLALMLVLISLAGCYKMGKATGKAADQVEESAEEFKDGYDQGKTN